MSRIARYVAAGLLVSLAIPSFAGAADTFKDVIVRNSSDQPVPVNGQVAVSNLPSTQQVSGSVAVSNLPEAPQLLHGDNDISWEPKNDVLFPDDLVLTDLVMTLTGIRSELCEVLIFEQHGADRLATVFFYLTLDDPTAQLHLESGVTKTADGWGVTLSSNCTVKVLWSGYRR